MKKEGDDLNIWKRQFINQGRNSYLLQAHRSANEQHT